MVMRSVADTPVRVIVASIPEPENFRLTSPGGTPVSVNCPLPSTAVEMSVPTIVTVTLVAAIVLNTPGAVMAVETPVTRPIITAPRDARLAEGAVGEYDASDPHPAAVAASAVISVSTQRFETRVTCGPPGIGIGLGRTQDAGTEEQATFRTSCTVCPAQIFKEN